MPYGSHIIQHRANYGLPRVYVLNKLRPRRNRHHFADDIFKCIYLHENVWISIEISLKFVPKGPINNIPGLVQIMAWRRLGDKPLSEPMMVRLLTHICVSRPQYVNPSRPGHDGWHFCTRRFQKHFGEWKLRFLVQFLYAVFLVGSKSSLI